MLLRKGTIPAMVKSTLDPGGGLMVPTTGVTKKENKLVNILFNYMPDSNILIPVRFSIILMIQKLAKITKKPITAMVMA